MESDLQVYFYMPITTHISKQVNVPCEALKFDTCLFFLAGLTQHCKGDNAAVSVMSVKLQDSDEIRSILCISNSKTIIFCSLPCSLIAWKSVCHSTTSFNVNPRQYSQPQLFSFPMFITQSALCCKSWH
jgi:hypothetical protein